MEDLKYLKKQLSIFTDKAQYLFYDKELNTWYFVSDVTGEELNSNNISNLVVSSVIFKNSLFKNIFNKVFSFLMDIIKQNPENYFIKVRQLNLYLNNRLKSESKEFNTDDILMFSKFNIIKFLNLVKNKIDTDSFIEIPLLKSNIERQGISFIDVNKHVAVGELKTKNIFVPLKNGYCVSQKYIKDFDNDTFCLKLYSSNGTVFNYSVFYENDEMIIESIQPFSIFTSN